MSTLTGTTTRTRSESSHSGSMRPLVWLEIRRFARHPVFLTGVASCIVVLVMAMQELTAHPTNDRVGAAVVSLFVGLFSVLTAYLITRSMKDSAEVLEATPTSVTRRTAAVCAMCSVSGLVAAAFGVFGLVSLRVWPIPDWLFGTFSDADVVVAMAQQTAVAAIGGTLVGVAAGRWLRFRGAGFALIVALPFWVFLSSGATAAAELGGTWPKLARVFSPFAFFQTQQVSPVSVDTFPGSPRWYLLWLLALCALAVVAALLYGAEGVVRTRLMRLGPALLAMAALCLVLTATQGPQHVVRSYPNGTTSVITTR
jgi:hypothetical protein